MDFRAQIVRFVIKILIRKLLLNKKSPLIRGGYLTHISNLKSFPYLGKGVYLAGAFIEQPSVAENVKFSMQELSGL